MTIPSLLTPTYWFSPVPLPFIPWIEKTLVIAFLVLFIAGIIARVIALRQSWEKMTRRVVTRAASVLIVLGLFGLFLMSLEFERIYMLGARAGFLLWIAVFAWYGWRMYRLVYVEIPATKARREEQERQNKWLPK